MEMTDNVNTTTILILVFAAIFLVCWLVWVVRLILCKRNLRSRDRLLLKRFEDTARDKRMISSYEELLESYKTPSETAGHAVTENDSHAIADFRKGYRQLENQVRQSKVYLKEKVSKDELAALAGMDRKALDQMFHDVSPIESVSDWIDSFRVTKAIAAIRSMKAEKKTSKSAKEGQAEEDVETRINRIAKECGFSGRRAMNSACKKIVGMTLAELHRTV